MAVCGSRDLKRRISIGHGLSLKLCSLSCVLFDVLRVFGKAWLLLLPKSTSKKYPFSCRNSKLSGLLQCFLHHEIGEIWDFPKCPNVNA
jgi:hypothetical protein